MENKKVAVAVAVAAVVMILISTFTPLALAADEVGRSDGGNGDLFAVEPISRSNGGKGDSTSADTVSLVSSNRKTLRSNLFLPQGYLPDSVLDCLPRGYPCDGLITINCCSGCTCSWPDMFCVGYC